MSLGPIMDTARQGLTASRFGMELVGRNIANASDASYTRQEVQFENLSPNGVRNWIVRAQVDSFLEGRITQEQQTEGRLEAEQSLLSEVSGIFGSTESGLDNAIGQFFGSVSALATTPAGTVERASMLFSADSLVNEFTRESTALQQLSLEVDQDISNTLTRINSLASNIAELNLQIASAGDKDGASSLLRDQRQSTAEELAGLVGVDTYLDGQERMAVVIGGGIPLVESTHSFQLALGGATGFVQHAGIAVESSSGSQVDVTARITNGKLAGLMRVRDQVVDDAAADLDRIAAAMTLEFNRVHAQGYGLDGTTGDNFFSPLSASSAGNGDNRGGVTVTASITDMAAVTLDDYQVVFTSATQFDVHNATQGTVISSGNAYTTGMSVTVGGVQIGLADGTGAPVAGDRYAISTTRNTAANMQVILTDDRAIAASGSTATLPGDNTNALALSQLSSAKLLDGGTLTLSDKFVQVSSRVGLDAQAVEQAADAQGFVLGALQARRASVSGVSLDEEAAKLIQFQNSFQASARMIRVADEMIQTILNMV